MGNTRFEDWIESDEEWTARFLESPELFDDEANFIAQALESMGED